MFHCNFKFEISVQWLGILSFPWSQMIKFEAYNYFFGRKRFQAYLDGTKLEGYYWVMLYSLIFLMLPWNCRRVKISISIQGFLFLLNITRCPHI